MKKILFIIISLFCANTVFGQWTETGNNKTIGDLTIGNPATGSYSKLTIVGPNSPMNSDNKRDISFEFASAGNTKIRSYRGASWDTYLQFLTTYSNSTPLVRMHIAANGNVGIGTTAPQYKLDVAGPIRTENEIILGKQVHPTDGGQVTRLTLTPYRHTGGPWKFISRDLHPTPSIPYLDICYGSRNMLSLDATGKIGIGTLNPTHTLDVNGTIRAKEIKVDMESWPNWPDFVFASDYNLRKLSDVEAHINEHKHLPDMPSEAQVKEEGVNLAEMQAKLLQKIEELTLYVIEQDKKIERQNSKIESLEEELQNQRK